jgi:hypothetical protein
MHNCIFRSAPDPVWMEHEIPIACGTALTRPGRRELMRERGRERSGLGLGAWGLGKEAEQLLRRGVYLIADDHEVLSHWLFFLRYVPGRGLSDGVRNAGTQ